MAYHIRCEFAIQICLYLELFRCAWAYITGGQVLQAPEFGVGRTLVQIVPSDFVIGTKRSVLWPSEYAKIRFRPGLSWRAHDAPQTP